MSATNTIHSTTHVATYRSVINACAREDKSPVPGRLEMESEGTTLQFYEKVCREEDGGGRGGFSNIETRSVVERCSKIVPIFF